MRTVTAIGLGSIIAVLLANALLRGPWLDEFWSQQYSDLRIGIVPLVRDRWLHDMNPPLFSMWTTILSALGLEGIPSARLATNIPPLVAIILTARRFARRMPDQYVFHAALLLLVLSTPVVVTAFANYRSYFWQIAAMTMLVQVARHVALADKDLSGKNDAGLATIAIVACASSIMLHYIGGLFGAALSTAILACALINGFRRWASLMAFTIAGAGIATLFFAWIEAPNWVVDLNHSWVSDQQASPVILVIVLVAKAVIHDPVPLIGLKRIRSTWNPGDTLFAGTISAALLSTILLLFVIDTHTSVILERYLVSIPVLIAALMATLAAKLANERKWLILLATVAAAAVIVPFAWRGPSRQWQANAGHIAQIVVTCRTTKVYAATGWLLRDGSDSIVARGEDPVFARGYAYLAARNGFTFQIIGRDGPTQARLGVCPTLLWIEHVPLGHLDSPAILAAAGLRGLESAKLSLSRTESGLIVRADRQ